VTDVVMPGMSGWELARRLQEERPGLETLYISGDAENTVVHQGPGDKKVNFLQKPFAAGALVQKVRTLLDAAPDGP